MVLNGMKIASLVIERDECRSYVTYRRSRPMDQADEIYAICRVSEVVNNRAIPFVLVRIDAAGDKVPWRIFVIRKNKQIFGYVNNCPHQHIPLDFEPGQFLDSSLEFLLCGKHSAQFEIESGVCFEGPCKGHRLEPIDLIIDDGDLCVTGVLLAEEDGLDLPEPDEYPEVMITSD
jgi:nitrite reductase/ring-hydroxylating ferredoxin subunit